MSVNTQILKLDDAANTAAYNIYNSKSQYQKQGGSIKIKKKNKGKFAKVRDYVDYKNNK